MNRPSMSWRARGRAVSLALAASVVVFAVVAVVCAPFFLAELARAPLPWSQLGNVGDAYGGASALLSAAALCGVGFSLVYQQKQLKQELTSNDRQRHHDLIKLALENPEFLQVLEPELAANPTGRLEVYANLVMHYWLAAWELGEVDDDELRKLTSMMFRGPAAREWWHKAGTSWIGTQTRQGRQHFIDLVSYEEAKASSAARAAAARHDPHPQIRGRRRYATLVAVGAVAAALFRLRRAAVRHRAEAHDQT